MIFVTTLLALPLVYAQEDSLDSTSRDDFVVFVEHHASFEDLNSRSGFMFKKISKLPDLCEKFTTYTKSSHHAFRVANRIDRQGIQSYPLSIHELWRRSPSGIAMVEGFIELFDCLSEIAKVKGFRGINFSIAVTIPDGDEAIESARLNLRDKIRAFLISNPETYITIAMGNNFIGSRQRQESNTSMPQRDICVGSFPENLFCVTKVHAFEGSIEFPHKPVARYSESTNLFAFRGGQSDTSFLSPTLLSLLVKNKDLKFVEEYIVGKKIDGTEEKEVLQVNLLSLSNVYAK